MLVFVRKMVGVLVCPTPAVAAFFFCLFTLGIMPIFQAGAPVASRDMDWCENALGVVAVKVQVVDSALLKRENRRKRNTNGSMD